MNLIILDTTTKSIEAILGGAVAATQPDYISAFADATAAGFVEGQKDGTLNSTTAVTIVSAPAASARRIVREISIYNADSAAVTLTVRLNNNGTYRIIDVATLAVGETWTLSGVGAAAAGAVTGVVMTADYDAQTILRATTDNTPTVLTVGEQTVVGRATGGNIAALTIDSDLSNVSANDDTIPSAKATKAMGDLKMPLAGGTMTGKIVSSGSSEVAKTYTPATGAQTVALDCALNNFHEVTGHASGTAITFSVSNVVNSQVFVVSILQGGTTVSTIAAWFATIRWAGGAAPTLTATLNKRDTFIFIRTGADTYDGFVVGQNC